MRTRRAEHILRSKTVKMARMEAYLRSEMPKEDDARIPEEMWYQKSKKDQGKGTGEALQMIGESMLGWQKINLVKKNLPVFK